MAYPNGYVDRLMEEMHWLSRENDRLIHANKSMHARIDAVKQLIACGEYRDSERALSAAITEVLHGK